MKLLLDTHVWIWSMLDPDRLSRKTSAILRSPENELWLSSISLWEFLMMVGKGRILLKDDPDRWLDAAFEMAPINEAPLSFEIVRTSRKMRFPHRDPADHFIAATAMTLNLTLVTADKHLLRLEGLKAHPA